MKKLAFIAMGYIQKYDGVSVYSENLLFEFLKDAKIQNREIKIDIFVGKSVLALLKSRIFINDTAYHDNVSFIGVNDKNFFIKMLDLMKKLYQKNSYDLVFSANFIPLLFSPGKRVRTIHDLSPEKNPQLYTRFHRFYHAFLLKSGKYLDDAIGYISACTEHDYLKTFYKIEENNKKLLYVPNGIPFKVRAYARPEDYIVKKKYQQPFLQLLVVGRINRAKGVDRILAFCRYFDASSARRRQFESVTLHFAGKQTEETKYLFEGANFKNITLIFHGFVDDETLNTLYKRAHFCFFLSRNEGYGLPLVETLWFKSIPILSNIGIFKEILGASYPMFDEQTGYTKAIEAFIVRILNDPAYAANIQHYLEDIVKKESKGYQTAAKNLLAYVESLA